ncbi:hypothetical protein NNX13_22050 [Pseudomonas sp. Eb3]|jgi:hypothetical protein|uniref:Uncharacterized protein n=2 Tax=Pseudomonas TaxID=286 RepID=A0A7W2LK27_9PSED|nr:MULTISPECIES: hypothetical protein [Pseudomonas]APO81627.1 hypothetical protein BL240_09285 [Pseudomonas putida]AVD86219.1 hypothetical protein C4Q26_03265 [Pseudomonas sp. SWI44]MBA6142314.1 hypothetical protein [Pseudomonas juntendi]MBC3421815.1 hypothetical protein [Pseudomonas sp. RW3S2]MCQ1992509.1 hypothetical protein [Pseudomonas sp. Eb3]
MYADQSHKRDTPRKVRFNKTLDRILARAAERAEMQHATYLYEMIEWAVENGAIEALSKDDKQSSAA